MYRILWEKPPSEPMEPFPGNDRPDDGGKNSAPARSRGMAVPADPAAAASCIAQQRHELVQLLRRRAVGAAIAATVTQRGAGVQQEHVHVRGAGGGDGRVLGGEHAGAGWVRVRVQGSAGGE